MLSSRSLEIDFLRGIAVLLVMFNHHWFGIDWLHHMGWVGVDLFFSLSGFLVAGLLFKEYQKHNDIKPFHFLIRRGFKIYPLFYLSIFFTFIYLYFFSSLNNKGVAIQLLPDVFFLQNYLWSFWTHHWSLAVEEHFYLFLTILLFVLFKVGLTKRRFVIIAVSVAVLCLIFRIVQNHFMPEAHNFYQTHLRMDSLFAGVTLSYVYHCHQKDLKEFYKRNRYLIGALTLLPLTALIGGLFVKTIGFTLIYIGFTALLLVFLFGNIAKHLQTIFSSYLYRFVAFIGFYSYGIYLFHFYFIKFVVGDMYGSIGDYTFTQETLISFTIYFIGSILLGAGLSYLVEKPALNLRDRYFPRR